MEARLSRGAGRRQSEPHAPADTGTAVLVESRSLTLCNHLLRDSIVTIFVMFFNKVHVVSFTPPHRGETPSCCITAPSVKNSRPRCESDICFGINFNQAATLKI